MDRLLKHFLRQPKIENECVLQNLYNLLVNIDLLLDQNSQLCMTAITLINLIAFKSTQDVRKIMKELKLLQLRDRLMVETIRKTYSDTIEVEEFGKVESLVFGLS